MMLFCRAEKEADWPLHLRAVSLMIPYFFAAGHHNYARYGLYYLRSSEAMPDEICRQFLQGEHVTRHLAGAWNGMWMLGAICGYARSMDLAAQSMDR